MRTRRIPEKLINILKKAIMGKGLISTKKDIEDTYRHFSIHFQTFKDQKLFLQIKFITHSETAICCDYL